MIYLDNAATTKLHPDVLMAMMEYWSSEAANASSTHRAGRMARESIERARTAIADFIGCADGELIFTSGGTESNHSALFGAFLASERRHIIVSAVEHHAVLHTASFLESIGAEVTVVGVDREGRIRAEDIVACLRPDTLAVAVMLVNNELGTIEPIADIVNAVKAVDSSVLVHCDMVQALGTLKLNLHQLGIDTAAFSAHKIHGPSGVGALYIRQGTPWKSVLHGGEQERRRRAGTEHAAGIVGFRAAVGRLARDWEGHVSHLVQLHQACWGQLHDVPGIRRYSPIDSVPSILNVGFGGVRNHVLLMRLDLQGVALSAGSACTAGSIAPSHVIKACGWDVESAEEAVRISFSDLNTLDEVRTAADAVVRVVEELRQRK